MRVPVSVVIITKNEEQYIGRCLDSVAWADEVLVVDGGSTDRTVQLCEGRARVLKREWTGFRDQRNFAIQSAAHDWVLVVDSDEACSPELARKIRGWMEAGGPPHRAYKVRRQEYFLGRAIYYGIWNPSYQDRFFHRAGVSYINEVHEYPRFAVEPLRIEEPIHHAPDFNAIKFLDKMNRYTTIEARDRVAQGQRTNAFRLFFAFPAMFLKNYFYYGAYKDGMHGFVISLLEGGSRVVRHIKIWQMSRGLER